MPKHTPDPPSVYHAEAPNPGPAVDRAPAEGFRNFYIDLYNEGTDDFEHEIFGVVAPNGLCIAHGLDGTGFYSLEDPEGFAERIHGILVWA
jgi:hypothetical protein